LNPRPDSDTFVEYLDGVIQKKIRLVLLAVCITKVTNSEAVHGANVAIPLTAVEFSTRDGMEKVLESGPWLIRLVPIFLNIWTPNTRLTKEMITYVPIWVKLHNISIVAYSKIGLSLITSQVGNPIMLDAYTSSMCQISWGKNDYARALIEVSSLNPIKDSVVVAIPFPNGSGHSLETIEIEYEWIPPWCETCKIFAHDNKECPKNVKVQAATVKAADGFTKVVEKQPNQEGSGSSNPIPDKPMEYPKQKDPTSSSVPTKYSFETLTNHETDLGNMDFQTATVINDDEDEVENVYDDLSGSSRIDTGMRNFQECVDMIEVTDVNSTGLCFTWNQKPKGEDGILKKIDRVMANLEFLSLFA
nr:zinc knuckle CX2CX4HX4C [Tanacetum cinerariifolium]